MDLRRYWIPSPNYTSGYQARRLIVLHTSEGAQTYESLGNFFANPSSQVSSHVGIDDKRGSIGEYVKRGNTAWTASGANPVAIQAELCTPSGAASNWSRSTWMDDHHNMLLNAADWVREEAENWGIPLNALNPQQAQGNGRGVCQHKDLGLWGGGHTDCGPGFPMDYVIDLARGGTPNVLEKEAGVFYLQFPEGGDDSTLVFTNDEADGKHRLRLGCQFAQHVRIDQAVGPTVELELGYNQGAQGFLITEGCKFAVVHLDEGDATRPIAACISS